VKSLWGDELQKERSGRFNHVVLMRAIDGIDTVRGVNVAGNRGYFMKGNVK